MSDEAITPENGWIFEKDGAVKAVKCERNKQNIFRLARAYHKLRQWKKLENITSLTAIDEIIPIISNKSSVDDDDDNSRSSKFYRKQLSAWNKVARDHLSQYTQLTDKLEKQVRLKDANYLYLQHDHHKNYNTLHFAAEKGDILLLEKAVALGAALIIGQKSYPNWLLPIRKHLLVIPRRFYSHVRTLHFSVYHRKIKRDRCFNYNQNWPGHYEGI